MDNLTKEQRHKNMSHIRSEDTSIELRLRRTLWHKGYRYRKNVKALPGKPDIVLTKYHICIFCDSEYFHGKDFEERAEKIKNGTNGDYWYPKIKRNVERDLETEKRLNALGWTVLRFWGRDIQKNLDEVVQTIDDAVFTTLIEKEK